MDALSRFAPLATATLSLSAALAAPLAAQGSVHVVDDDGTAPFTTISDALAAVQPGDMVLVKDGTYGSFIINRTATVVAEDNATVVVQGGVRISGTSGVDVVVLDGLAFTPATKFPLEVENCAGPVFLQDCIFSGPSDPTLAVRGDAGKLDASKDVVLSNCIFVGGSPGTTAPIPEGGLGLEVLGGTDTHIFDCTIVGGNGAPTGTGGDGLYIDEGSFLFLSNSTLQGGSGGAGSPACLAGDGGAAITVAGVQTEARLLDSVGFGGLGGNPGGASCPPGKPGPSTTIQGGSITLMPGDARTMTHNNPVRDGQTVDLTFTGEPGDVVLLGWSTYANPSYNPFVQATLILAPHPPFKLLTAGTVPASGVLQNSIPITPFQGQSAHMVIQQLNVLTSPTLEVRAGTGSVLMLLDASL